MSTARSATLTNSAATGCDPRAVSQRFGWLVATSLALLGSQVGHLLTYQVRFGGQATMIESQGVHTYFPATARLVLALAGAVVLASLLVIGAARIVAGRCRGLGLRPGWSLVDAVALMFTAQLAIFAGQETIEAVAGGAPLASGLELLLFGTVGQLPVACLAGLALSWITSRLVASLESLHDELSIVEVPYQRFVEAPVRIQSYCEKPLRICAPAVYVKRGPPEPGFQRT